MTTTSKTTNSEARRLPPNVYPLQAFLDVERLMHKLNMTPADVLTLLAEVLTDLDQQIDAHEAQDDVSFPLWALGGVSPRDSAASRRVRHTGASRGGNGANTCICNHASRATPSSPFDAPGRSD